MPGDGYDGKGSPHLLSYFLIFYTTEQYSLDSLSSVLDDYPNIHGHLNKCG